VDVISATLNTRTAVEYQPVRQRPCSTRLCAERDSSSRSNHPHPNGRRLWGQIFDRCSRVFLSQSWQRGDRDIDRAGCFRDHPQRFGIESDVGEIELLISAATHPRRPRCSEGRSSQPRPSSAHCKESAVRSTAVRLQTGICLSEVSRLRYCL
jgi:hypothetical protein